ncbi:MAG: ABC transporter substrate-binding protein [Nostoc sp. CreGUA01]|nr:ABC transporter substrate-binding protein [Nostoc sp. CreGUA01]
MEREDVKKMRNLRNPYMIGKPIFEHEKFFGREELFQFIKDNLNGRVKCILLHGERRIGKSSVLRQIHFKTNLQKFVFVCCDLQEHSKSSLSQVLYNLAEQIAENLGTDFHIITLPSQQEFHDNFNTFAETFLTEVYDKLDDKNLVLLLDEFEVVGSDDNILNHGESFFRYLHSLLNQHEKLFIIPVVGRAKDDLQNLLDLFKDSPYQEVGLLNDLSAKRLIINPAQGTLEYEENAIKAILKLSSGHPYFTQIICHDLFTQARFVRSSKVTLGDVEGIVDKAIESASGGLAWFWDGLPIAQQIVFLAVAEAQTTAIDQNKSIPEDPFTLLKTYGVIQTEELIQAAKQLADKGYLDDIERRVKIELVRRWLVRSYKLNQEIFNLEKIKEKEINEFFQQELELHRHGNIQNIIDHYEKVLTINPNHFSITSALAQKYLDVENFEKALILYTRLYQLNPSHNKEQLLLAREAYGKNLRKKGELIKAKVQFEGVLEIESHRESAKQQLVEINAELEKQEASEIETQEVSQIQEERQFLNLNKNQLITWIRQPMISLPIIGVITILGGIIVYRSFTSCPEGQQRINGSCISIVTPPATPKDNIQSNISRGDRTLFSTIPNPYLKQGIEAFKEGYYPQAIKSFQNAVNDNRNDPEALIYYNNSKALDKAKITGEQYNPFTLAVVIPADNGKDRALEILRGVAQSQEQFNVNGGRDGRLLQIIIANDGGDPNKAKQIAEELVKDQSILTVIGHGSSKTTQAGLDIYKRADIPIISPTSTANTLQGKNFFRTTPSDAALGEKLGTYATNYPLKKVVIVYNPVDSYSNSLREEFEKNFEGQIIDRIDLKDPTLNIEQKLKDSAEQQVQAVILFPDVENTATALDVAKVNVNNNLRLKLLAGDSLYNNKTLDDAKNVYEGLVLVVPWFREAPQAQNFSQTAKQFWGGEISWRTATSYDATQAFLKSLSSRASTATILQQLQNLNLPAKITSGNELKFQNGERQSKAILVKVDDQGLFTCLDQCSP